MSVTNGNRYIGVTAKGEDGQMPTDGAAVVLFSSVPQNPMGQRAVLAAKKEVQKFFASEINDTFRYGRDTWHECIVSGGSWSRMRNTH